MSDIQEFEVQVDGSSYLVDIGLKSFCVRTGDVDDDGYISTRIIEDSFGDCNPLISLWNSWEYQRVQGAARTSMEGAARTSMEYKCIRAAVECAIERHEERCLEEAFGDQ